MYRVKAIKNFTDKETGEHRVKDVSVFDCTLERYTFLKNNNAVVLVEEIIDEIIDEVVESEEINNIIDEVVEEVVEEVIKEKPKKKKASKK
jgi:hypothetical protein